MASPQEVIELAIPHPADSTHSSRRASSERVIQALHANEFYFVHRKIPVLDRDDGQCPHCKCELVHVQGSPAYENAEARMYAQSQRIRQLEEALFQYEMKIKQATGG